MFILGGSSVPTQKWSEFYSYPRFTDALYEVGNLDPGPDFILVGGDIVEYARAEWFRDFGSIADSYFAQYGIPIYAVAGNHDRYLSDWGNAKCWMFSSFECEDDLAAFAANLSLPGPGLNEDNYLIPSNPFNYEFTHKGVQFIGIDTGGDFMPDYEKGDTKDEGPECAGLTSEQIVGLNSLDPETKKIAFLHSPVISGSIDPFTVGMTLEDASFANNYYNFLSWASSSNLALALSGHTHESHIFKLDRSEYQGASTLAYNGETLYVQTQSASKDNELKHGYRLINIADEEIFVNMPSETGKYGKIVSRLEVGDEIKYLTYDADSNFVGPENINGLSNPFFGAAATGRIISYEHASSSQFDVYDAGLTENDEYDLEIRLEDNNIPAAVKRHHYGYRFGNDFFKMNQSFVSLNIDRDSDTAKVYLENIKIAPEDTDRIKVDWIDYIMSGSREGIELKRDANSDGSYDEIADLKPMSKHVLAILGSPAELYILDESGQRTGQVEGKTVEEIAYSYYEPENETVVNYFPEGDYTEERRYRVVGLEDPFGPSDGTYNLSLILNGLDDEIIRARAIDIPILPGAIHEYIVDWDALLRGEDGLLVKIDMDGDGEFDFSYYTDGEFTYEHLLFDKLIWDTISLHADDDIGTDSIKTELLVKFTHLKKKYEKAEMSGWWFYEKSLIKYIEFSLELVTRKLDSYLAKNWITGDAYDLLISDIEEIIGYITR